MNEEKLKQTFSWYSNLSKTIQDSYKLLIKTAEEFKQKLNDEKLRLPYHINLIDELHINENSNSRILYKLLLYKNEYGKYEILDSLINYTKDKYAKDNKFESIHVTNPIISQEIERIDLWVRDKSYAIIFENKIYNAQDQEAQLARYIDKTKAQGYSLNQIYIIYLSATGEEPEDQSWGSYKKPFTCRYVNLSFKYDILLWLKDIVLPNIRLKEVYLESAVKQYIDYLEGLFYLRTTEQQMTMNLDKILISQFNLGGEDEPQKNYSILQEKIDDMNEVVNAMHSLQDRYKLIIIKDWQAKTKEMFPNLHPCSLGEFTDVSIPENGKTIKVFIGNENDKRLYCQAEYINVSTDEDRNIVGTIIESLKGLLPSSDRHHVWKYLPYNAFDDVFELFAEVTKHLCKELNVQY